MDDDFERLRRLKDELVVLDAQRRGMTAEIARITGSKPRRHSVVGRMVAYLRNVGGPATTAELLTFVLQERPTLNPRACRVSLYRGAKASQIIRQGAGWVLPAEERR